MLAPAKAESVSGQECLQAGLSTDSPAQTVTTTVTVTSCFLGSQEGHNNTSIDASLVNATKTNPKPSTWLLAGGQGHPQAEVGLQG